MPPDSKKKFLVPTRDALVTFICSCHADDSNASAMPAAKKRKLGLRESLEARRKVLAEQLQELDDILQTRPSSSSNTLPSSQDSTQSQETMSGEETQFMTPTSPELEFQLPDTSLGTNTTSDTLSTQAKSKSGPITLEATTPGLSHSTPRETLSHRLIHIHRSTPNGELSARVTPLDRSRALAISCQLEKSTGSKGSTLKRIP